MVNSYKFAAYLSLSLTSLRCNRLRSFLSMIGVVFGVMAVIIIISVGEGAKREALRQIEGLGARNIYVKSVAVPEDQKPEADKTRSPGLSLRDARRIQNGCAHVQGIAAVQEIPAPIIGALAEITPQVLAVSPSYAGILNLKLAQGRFIHDADIAGHHLVCVAGAHIAAQLGPDGTVGSLLRIGDHLFHIIGILDRYDIRPGKLSVAPSGPSTPGSSTISGRNYNDIILIPENGKAWLMPDVPPEESADRISELVIQADHTEHVMAAAAVIRDIMAVSHEGGKDYQIVTPLELLNQSRKTGELFNLLLAAVASVSLLVGGIGIMNIMLAGVSERKREIGIRRAVGAKQKHILAQFLAEASLLTLAGGVIGILLGLFAVFVMQIVGPWAMAVTPGAILLPLALATLTGVFFGSYPAWKAARLNPIQALTG